MTPPTSRTWAKRGTTPVIRVRGRSQHRFSIAALCCYTPGERSRLVHRPKRHTDHKSGGRKSFAWTEYRDLLIAAHQQLDGPIVLVWDNLNVHKDRRMRAFIDAHDWVTAYHLPPYTPDLNPVEGIWSILRRTCPVRPVRRNPTGPAPAGRPARRTGAPPPATTWAELSDGPRPSPNAPSSAGKESGSVLRDVSCLLGVG